MTKLYHNSDCHGGIPFRNKKGIRYDLNFKLPKTDIHLSKRTSIDPQGINYPIKYFRP